MFNALIFGLFFACGEEKAVDADADGFVEAEDCDDSNAAINPDAAEVCDGVDNNCDNEVDNNASDALTFYEDADGDGYGDAEVTAAACEVPEGFIDNMDDCDDVDADINPIAIEICDGVDNDCDELTDDSDDDVDLTTGMTYYEDADADGFGDEEVSMMACEMPVGYVANMNDCDDTVVDVDGDGDGFLACKGDCDDEDATAFPGSAELESEVECMRDADDDGFGDLNVQNCVLVELFDTYGDAWNGYPAARVDAYDADGNLLGSGTVSSSDDCVDETLCNSGENYYAQEVCASTEEITLKYVAGIFSYTNYNDENAIRITDSDGMVYEFGPRFTDATTGEALPVLDADQDLLTIAPSAVSAGTDCDDADATVGSGDLDGDGYDACDIENPLDCDDSDATINPSVDADADGFNMCEDCNDADETINPDADEVWYDGVDQDCDGWSDYDMDMDGADAMSYIDPADGVTVVEWTGYDCDDDNDSRLPLANEADPTACYYDSDGDGYGDDDPSQTNLDIGIVAGTDCYDWSASAYPGAAYNELDVDGDGVTDCTYDYDGDGYGSATTSYAAQGTDCADYSDYIYPGAAYNELDVDGDGVTDCTEDSDGDGYGDSDSYYGVDGTDCDDSDETLNPSLDADADGANACEDCDDSDSSKQGFMGYVDADGDGFGTDSSAVFVCSLDEDGDGTEEYVAEGGDCLDSSWSTKAPFTYPGAAFMEDIDVDGDGNQDCTQDADEDGYGDIAGTYDYFESGTDCDDGDDATYPGAGYLEASPLDEQCLTDEDGDGYAAGIPGLYEVNASMGDCYTFTIEDSYGDGCNGTVDLYADGVYVLSLAGPAIDTVSYTECVPASGFWQVGWTEDTGYFNSECSFSIVDGSGTEVYASSGILYNLVPGGGTDSNDSDASTH